MLVVTSLLFQISPPEHLEAIRSVFHLSRFPASVIDKFDEGVSTARAGWFLTEAYYNLIRINLLWGLVNLLPLWPLDGGQATQILLTIVDRCAGRAGSYRVTFGRGRPGHHGHDHDQRHIPHDFLRVFRVHQLSSPADTSQAHSLGLYQDDDWWRR